MSSFELELLSRIYVLRCWVEPQTQPLSIAPAWRFRLESVRDEHNVGFATLDELILFMQETFGNDECVQIKESK